MHHTDALIIGGGHNGLVCAAYLARAGLSVIVLERRHVLGGAAVTQEFHPGYRNSTLSYTVSLLNPKVIAELGLHAHGLRIVERPLANFLPTEDGGHLKTGGGGTQRELAHHSVRDAAALPAYEAELDRIADVLRDLTLETPPNVTEHNLLQALPDMLGAARLGRKLRRLTLTERRALLDLFTRSAGDHLDGWFESAPIKAVFGFDGVVGHYASPYAPGSAYVLLHHVFGEVNGVKGAWGHAVGGMGAISAAIARAARAAGADVRVDAGVAAVLTSGGRATGVVTTRGETFTASAVIANCHPRVLYGGLLPMDALPTAFARRIATYRSGSGTFRMNVALSELPRFTCHPEPGPHLSAGIILAPTLAYMDRAWMDARAHGWSRAPIVEMLIPSTLDDGLAPPGHHVASLFCQHVSPEIAGGWDRHRDTVADLMIATVDAHAPGFKASMLGRMALTPDDLERDYGLVGGDIFHGRLTLDQLFSARPMLGHADYRGPLPGLYMCGAGTHPGGGVTGAPGHNAAREVLRDFRRGRLRQAA